MNILNNIKIPKKNEEFKLLLEHKNIKIMRIVSSDKLQSQEYKQDEDEWVLILEGKATLIVDSKKIKLSKGDTLFIPAKSRHKIKKVKKGTVWLAVHIF
ncbi:MAG: cupin domain-containing protein [Sulfurovum sp.]